MPYKILICEVKYNLYSTEVLLKGLLREYICINIFVTMTHEV